MEHADAIPASPAGCASFAIAAGETKTGSPMLLRRTEVWREQLEQSMKTRGRREMDLNIVPLATFVISSSLPEA